MSDGIQFAGEFDLQEALVISPTGEVTDLLTDLMVVEINIFEDIFKNSISGSVLVTDTRNIFSKLPMMGQEKLSLKIATPSFADKKDIIDFTEEYEWFDIHKISSRMEVGSGAQIYDLQFVSPEVVKNTRRRVSTSGKGSINEIVLDLLSKNKDGVQTGKEIFIEETLGSRKFVIPNSNPFTFITKLTKEAISKNGSPHYFFFENKNGYHFRSLQSLYSEPVKDNFHGGDKAHDEIQDPGQINSGKQAQSFARILESKLNSDKDLLLNSLTGMFGGKVIEHDIYNKKYNVKTFNYFDNDDFGLTARIDGGKGIKNNRVYSDTVLGMVDDKLKEEITNSKIHLIPVARKGNSDAHYKGNDSFITTPNQQFDTLLNRQSRFLELQEGISINMSVHGRTNLTVGDIVSISLPTLGDEGDGEENKYYSGNYMIKELRHTFSQPTRSHIISMMVVRDSLSDELKSTSVLTQTDTQTNTTPKIIGIDGFWA